MNIDLTPIFQALIGLFAAIITARLSPWIKSRTTESQQVLMKAAIRSAVYTAEQLFGSGHGAEKMDYALSWLREKGFDVDSREVEAAVYEMFNLFREYDAKDAQEEE